MSGYSFTLARKPLKNGLLVAGCAVILTVVTVGFMPSESIWFGVLHLNAAAVLLTCLLHPLLRRCPAPAGLAVSAVLFALTNQLPEGYLGFENLRLCALPAAWVPFQSVLAGAAGFSHGFLRRIISPSFPGFSCSGVGIIWLVCGAAHRAGTGCTAAAGLCGTAYAACLYASPAR